MKIEMVQEVEKKIVEFRKASILHIRMVEQKREEVRQTNEKSLREWDSQPFWRRLIGHKPEHTLKVYVPHVFDLTLMQVEDFSPFLNFQDLPSNVKSELDNLGKLVGIQDLVQKLRVEEATTWDTYESHHFHLDTNIPMVILEVSGSSCRHRKELTNLHIFLRQA